MKIFDTKHQTIEKPTRQFFILNPSFYPWKSSTTSVRAHPSILDSYKLFCGQKPVRFIVVHYVRDMLANFSVML